MTARKLSLVQRIARALVSARMFAAMEEASRKWTVECPHCGFGRSVWELGGIRYKAAGTPRQHGRCLQCGRNGWHKIRWTDTP
jgi:ribosomal protein L37E